MNFTWSTACVQHWFEEIKKKKKKKTGEHWLSYDSQAIFVTEEQGERSTIADIRGSNFSNQSAYQLEFRCRVRYLQAAGVDITSGHNLWTPLEESPATRGSAFVSWTIHTAETSVRPSMSSSSHCLHRTLQTLLSFKQLYLFIFVQK
jgi:hypothetical protein